MKAILIQDQSIVNWDKVVAICRYDDLLKISVIADQSGQVSVTEYKFKTIEQLNTEWLMLKAQTGL